MARRRLPIGQSAGVKGEQHQSQRTEEAAVPAHQHVVGRRGVTKRGSLE